MSEMEIFHGYFEKSNLNIIVEDTHEFMDLEEKHQCKFIEVEGQLFKITKSEIPIDDFGFSVVIPKTDKDQLLLYWYNGGAGFHEVAEEAIKKFIQ